MLSFPLVCEIVVIESCLRMSAVSLDSPVCPTSTRNSGCSLTDGARQQRRLGTHILTSTIELISSGEKVLLSPL